MTANGTSIMTLGKYDKLDIERRTFICSVSAIGAATLAGCTGEEGPAVDDDENDSDSNDDEEPASEEDVEPEEEVEGEEGIEDPEEATATVEVEYDGEWSGVIETTATREEYEGEGAEAFEVDFDPEYDIVTAWFQKLVSGDESREISVRVIIDDEVVIEETVDGEYGMVRVQVEIG